MIFDDLITIFVIAQPIQSSFQDFDLSRKQTIVRFMPCNRPFLHHDLQSFHDTQFTLFYVLHFNQKNSFFSFLIKFLLFYLLYKLVQFFHLLFQIETLTSLSLSIVFLSFSLPHVKKNKKLKKTHHQHRESCNFFRVFKWNKKPTRKV